MFGLMFFPDRPKGYAELRRVLRPGAKAVVSSWAPIADSPLLSLMFGAVRVIDSSWPAPQRDPLGLENPDVLAAELRAAGFTDVEIVPHTLTVEVSDAADVWARMVRSSAPLVLLRRRIGEAAWAEREPHAVAYIETELAKASELSTTAWLGVGTA
jgi:SAM-dependent methyltransferase